MNTVVTNLTHSAQLTQIDRDRVFQERYRALEEQLSVQKGTLTVAQINLENAYVQMQTIERDSLRTLEAMKQRAETAEKLVTLYHSQSAIDADNASVRSTEALQNKNERQKLQFQLDEARQLIETAGIRNREVLCENEDLRKRISSKMLADES